MVSESSKETRRVNWALLYDDIHERHETSELRFTLAMNKWFRRIPPRLCYLVLPTGKASDPAGWTIFHRAWEICWCGQHAGKARRLASELNSEDSWGNGIDVTNWEGYFYWPATSDPPGKMSCVQGAAGGGPRTSERQRTDSSHA